MNVTISISAFKKSGEGFLARLLKHKQVEELAEELTHTYADEMQEELQSEISETDTAEDTTAEPITTFEIVETGGAILTVSPKIQRSNFYRRTPKKR